MMPSKVELGWPDSPRTKPPQSLPHGTLFRLLQLCEPRLVRPRPRQPVQLPKTRQLGTVRPDHLLAVLVSTHVHPLHLHPPPHRVTLDPHLASQTAHTILVSTQTLRTAVTRTTAQIQLHSQTAHHLRRELLRSLRRMEPLLVQPNRDRTRTQTLIAQHTQTFHQTRILRLVSVATHRSTKRLRLHRSAKPVQRHLRTIARPVHLHLHTIQQQPRNPLTIRCRRTRRRPHCGQVS